MEIEMSRVYYRLDFKHKKGDDWDTYCERDSLEEIKVIAKEIMMAPITRIIKITEEVIE